MLSLSIGGPFGLVLLLAGGPIGCTRTQPTDTAVDSDSDVDTDVDTDSDPPGACPLEVVECPSNAVPVSGEGTYTRVDRGGWFCLSPLTLAEGCDAYIPTYAEPGCPPIDWEGYGSWRRNEFTFYGRLIVKYDKEFRLDGDLVYYWAIYEDGQPIQLTLDRYDSEALWCCDDGQGGSAVQLLFGDATVTYPCAAEL